MTRKVYPDNASRQKAYRERLKKKQRERWETLFKKDKTIQPVEKTQATKPIELDLDLEKKLERKYSEHKIKINYLHSLKSEALEYGMTKEELDILVKGYSCIHCHNCHESVYAFLDTCPFCNTIVDWDWQ